MKTASTSGFLSYFNLMFLILTFSDFLIDMKISSFVVSVAEPYIVDAILTAMCGESHVHCFDHECAACFGDICALGCVIVVNCGILDIVAVFFLIISSRKCPHLQNGVM